ncbi:M35 family metallo-endopeptidase [Paraburkholderia sp.]|uniref:M35 family metallo-endopeptidase n=1 Tax=Paraburkholderia sp. TaxID=1926495 RepID=UPI002F43016C
MSDSDGSNHYSFHEAENEEWIEVHSAAVTNTNPGSTVHVTINTTPICPNMSNGDFRKLIIRLRDTALVLIRERIADVTRWDQTAQDRAKIWFGRADEALRARLHAGLPKLAAAMQELKPENIVRWDKQANQNLTCSIVPDSGHNDAAVCKPDSARRMIAIYSHFCTLPDVYVSGNCKLNTIIHECSHYIDTFNSQDISYGFGRALSRWGQNASEEAWCNADSIACYVAHFDDVQDFLKKKIW